MDALAKAFALAVPHDEALRNRGDVGFFQTVRSSLAKRASGAARPAGGAGPRPRPPPRLRQEGPPRARLSAGQAGGRHQDRVAAGRGALGGVAERGPLKAIEPLETGRPPPPATWDTRRDMKQPDDGTSDGTFQVVEIRFFAVSARNRASKADLPQHLLATREPRALR